MLRPQPRHTPAAACLTCANGCGCSGADPGCEHYGCYGARPLRSCPGVAAEEDRYAAACAQRRAEDARTLNRRARLSALYRAAVIAALAPPAL